MLYLLLKAVVTKTITVPQYTKADGTIVPAHQKTVHYDPDKTQADVINGNGTHSQKLAHAQLKNHKDWNNWSDDEKEAHIRAHGMDIHKKRMQADAVSRFKAAFGKDGKLPQSGHYLAFLNEPPEKQAKILESLKKKHGESKVNDVMNKLHDRVGKKPVEKPQQPEQKPVQKPEEKPAEQPKQEEQKAEEQPKKEEKKPKKKFGHSEEEAHDSITHHYEFELERQIAKKGPKQIERMHDFVSNIEATIKRMKKQIVEDPDEADMHRGVMKAAEEFLPKAKAALEKVTAQKQKAPAKKKQPAQKLPEPENIADVSDEDAQAMANDSVSSAPADDGKKAKSVKEQPKQKKADAVEEKSKARMQKLKEETTQGMSPGVADIVNEAFDNVMNNGKGEDYISAIVHKIGIEKRRAEQHAARLSYQDHLGNETEIDQWEGLADQYHKGIEGLNELSRQVQLKENEKAALQENEPLDQMLQRKLKVDSNNTSYENFFKEMSVDLNRPDVKKKLKEYTDKRYEDLASYYSLIPNKFGTSRDSKPWASWENDEGYSRVYDTINKKLGIKDQIGYSSAMHPGSHYTVDMALRSMAEHEAYKKVLDRANAVMKIINNDLEAPVKKFKERAKTVTENNIVDLMSDVSDEIADVRRKIGYSRTTEMGKKVLTEKKLEPLEKLYKRLSRKRF